MIENQGESASLASAAGSDQPSAASVQEPARPHGAGAIVPDDPHRAPAPAGASSARSAGRGDEQDDDEQEDTEVTLMDALGHRRGVIDSALAPVTFVLAFVISGQRLAPALAAALVAGLVVTLLRLRRRDTLRHALVGFAGVALAAFVASRTGRPQDFFLPSLLANLGAAAAWAVSIWIRRPFLGLVMGAVTRSRRWREDPQLLAAYCRASWIWVASFLVRVAVMTPLWLAGQTVALGLAKVAMGWPMVLGVIWLSWLIIEPVQRRSARGSSGPRAAAGTAAPTPSNSSSPDSRATDPIVTDSSVTDSSATDSSVTGSRATEAR